MSHQCIEIKGACTHNLQNISLSIPRNKLVVITGVSGSGKSSLAIHTLFSAGQRKYAESLNAYVRQFLSRMPPPDVASIKGLSPAIAIQQKGNTAQVRSTVGTMTEIYDCLKLLFAKIGKVYTPEGKEIKHYTTTDIIDTLKDKKGYAYITFLLDKTTFTQRKAAITAFTEKMFRRVRTESGEIKLWESLNEEDYGQDIYVIVDRILLENNINEEQTARLRESIDAALYEGKGTLFIFFENDAYSPFTNAGEDFFFIAPTEQLFSFNSSLGACPVCQGYGESLVIDEHLVIPNKHLSIADDAIAPWRGERLSRFKQQLIEAGRKSTLPLFKPIKDFTPKEYQTLWEGNQHFTGIHPFFKKIEKEQYKIQYRILLHRFRTKNICPECKGSRLRKEAHYVRIAGKNIADLVSLPAEQLKIWINKMPLNTQEKILTRYLLPEIKQRLNTLCKVGLGYLPLNRGANTLSGGESQRVKLTLSIGNQLTEALYILDEPSVGLHAKDTEKLLEVLRNLRDSGNTVIIIEHDEQIIKAADYIIDMGPYAGHLGGKILAAGDYATLCQHPESITAAYLNNTKKNLKKIRTPSYKPNLWLHLNQVCAHNLHNISVSFPLGCLCVLTGVSGSGKSTLLQHTLYPLLRQQLHPNAPIPFINAQLSGDIHTITEVTLMDQNAIGLSSRSNPASYVKAFDAIRNFYANLPASKEKGLSAGFFSTNVPGGRCEHCQGSGEEIIEMQFLADVRLPCENCGGKRYEHSVLNICYQGKNIADILDMNIADAFLFFEGFPKIQSLIQALQEVGLGYMRMGQSSATMSGGEAQRVKLASYLSEINKDEAQLFIFDEPTTGLHFHDIETLLHAFDKLIKKGHSILVIEHNTMLINNADWVIEMGPGSGEKGGKIIFEGSIDALKKSKKSVIAPYL